MESRRWKPLPLGAESSPGGEGCGTAGSGRTRAIFGITICINMFDISDWNLKYSTIWNNLSELSHLYMNWAGNCPG